MWIGPSSPKRNHAELFFLWLEYCPAHKKGNKCLILLRMCYVLSHSVVSDSLWLLGLSSLGSSVPEDSPGKNTEVGCHALVQGIFSTQGSNPGLLHCRQIFTIWTTKWVKSLSRVWLLATPWTAAYQAFLSMGFSRQEYWSGVPLPFPSEPQGKSNYIRS